MPIPCPAATPVDLAGDGSHRAATPLPSGAPDAAFADAAVGCVLLDADARIHRCNQAFVDLLGLAPGAPLERPLVSLVDGATGGALQHLLRDLAEGRARAGQAEVCFEPDPFSEVWADIAIAVQHDDAGRPRGFVAHVFDSRERRHRALQATQRYGLALQSAGMGLWEWSVATGEMEVDAYWAMSLGYALAQWTRHIDTFWARLHPDDRAEAQSAIAACLNGEIAEFRVEIRLQHAESHWLWVQHQGMLVERDATGAPRRVIGTTQDIQRRKTAEQALRRSERHQLLAINSARLGQWHWDAASRLITLDERCARTLGCPAEAREVSLALLRSRIEPEDREAFERGLQRLARDADGFSVECRLLHDGCDRVWVLAHGEVVERDARGRPLRMVGLIEDVTGRKQAEHELRAARDKAESASRAKSAFLANMSHEIRTPMNAMIGLTRIVLESELGARERDLLNKVHASSLSLLAILNDILDLSKIEAGRMVADRTPLSPQAVLGNVVQLFSRQAEDKGLLLQRDFSGLPPVVTGDPVRLAQVVGNLLGNAIKFTPAGEVEVRAGLRRRDDGTAVLECAVRDTGIGLSDEQMAALFQPFAQADESVTRRYGGTGLGLAISRQLVTLMGGELTASGAPGRGCTFRFWVPVGCPADTAAPPPLPAAAPPVTPPVGRPRFDGASVLLVDDIALNRQVTGEVLRKLGVRFVELEDGRQALEHLKTTAYDLVFMDLHMPVLDGLSATRQLMQWPAERRPPVVALTASVMGEDRERCAGAGMVDFVAKPVDESEIVRVLQRWLPPARAAAPAGSAAQAAAVASTASAPTAAEVQPDADLPALCAALRPYLQEQELVPEDLVERLRRVADRSPHEARWRQLLDRVFDFDHAGALSTLDLLQAQRTTR